MANLIAFILIALILGSSITYVVHAKKKGVKCIGCPVEGGCGGNCSTDHSCSGTCHCED
ncbi:MAG: FeoB-associated Cys-rich membrane protein [Eubacteriales bacterium]